MPRRKSSALSPGRLFFRGTTRFSPGFTAACSVSSAVATTLARYRRQIGRAYWELFWHSPFGQQLRGDFHRGHSPDFHCLRIASPALVAARHCDESTTRPHQRQGVECNGCTRSWQEPVKVRRFPKPPSRYFVVQRYTSGSIKQSPALRAR